jgi:hypothetical protein
LQAGLPEPRVRDEEEEEGEGELMASFASESGTFPSRVDVVLMTGPEGKEEEYRRFTITDMPAVQLDSETHRGDFNDYIGVPYYRPEYRDFKITLTGRALVDTHAPCPATISVTKAACRMVDVPCAHPKLHIGAHKFEIDDGLIIRSAGS